MVNLDAAGWTDDSTGVQLEHRTIPIDADSNRLLGHCLHQCILVVLLYWPWPTHASRRDHLGTAVGLACPLYRLVAVVSCLAEPFVFDVCKPIDRASALASHVPVFFVSTVQQLLRRQGVQRSAEHLPGTFQRTRGGKGPTRAAVPLILDNGHCTLSPPVDGTWSCCRPEKRGVLDLLQASPNFRNASILVLGRHTISRPKLVRTHVCEARDAHSVLVVLAVGLLDPRQVVAKDVHPSLLLFQRVVVLVVLSDESFKLVLASPFCIVHLRGPQARSGRGGKSGPILLTGRTQAANGQDCRNTQHGRSTPERRRLEAWRV
mmetsp:Transcript_4364/g.10201  ORF Transcript_4364/g.10201 Transcript_4364/m.10201 type:complete len:319 (-) Transcript_4364:10-966(-)